MNTYFILPFDHRTGFAREIMGVEYPFSPENLQKAKELKGMIWEAFLEVWEKEEDASQLGILLDEETGGEIFSVAAAKNITCILTLEESGKTPLCPLYPLHEIVTKINSTRASCAKLLIKTPCASNEIEQEQIRNVKEIADVCKTKDIPLLLEIVTTTDITEREKTILDTIDTLHHQEIFPDIWKLEAQTSVSAWKHIAAHAAAPIVVLGRGENEDTVKEYLKIAKQSGTVKGFAVGRTIFAKPLMAYIHNTMSKEKAIAEIARHFMECKKVWDNT